MTEPLVQYLAVLFQSVRHVISAERILKEAQVPHKIITVSPDRSKIKLILAFNPPGVLDAFEYAARLISRHRIQDVSAKAEFIS